MRRCRPALGTYVEITLPDDDARVELFDRALVRAFGAIRCVEACMSFHAAGSDLTRLNRSAHRKPQRVDPSTYEVLAMASEIHARTDGLFDAAVGARLVEWNLLPDHDGTVGGGQASSATLADLELLDDSRVAYRRPMCIDLGGIAKGYAVDRAIAALQDAGIDRAVVNAGGDLRVLGDAATPIHVRDPVDPQRLVFAGDLSDGAMATSAIYESMRRDERQMRSALVDPRSGRAMVEARSVSVLAPTCMVADALTKVVVAAADRNIGHEHFLAHFGAEALVLSAGAR